MKDSIRDAFRWWYEDVEGFGEYLVLTALLQLIALLALLVLAGIVLGIAFLTAKTGGWFLVVFILILVLTIVGAYAAYKEFDD